MKTPDINQRIMASYKLLQSDAFITREKFEAIRILVKGIDTQVDKALHACSTALAHLEKIQKNEIIELSAELLPETTEEEKKRKKALLLFIRSWQQLQVEITRVKSELEAANQSDNAHSHSHNQMIHYSKIAAFAKGPFGILTLAAIAIVGVQLFLANNRTHTLSNNNTPVITQQPVSITTIITADDDTILSFWVKEGKVETNGNQLIWSIHIHREDAEIRKKDIHIPATGAVVTAELRSKTGTTSLTGTVGGDGWVHWTQPLPRFETSLYIIDVKGDLAWAAKDQTFWKERPLATYKPGL